MGPAVRYDHVREFATNGWRVIRIGPKGGHTTVATYREEEAAHKAAEALNGLKSHEI